MESWLFGYLKDVPKDKAERKTWLSARFAKQSEATANRFRETLISLLGEEKGKAVKKAEAFEVCEYGTQPSKERLLQLFPFFDAK